jgi:large subunit ribosomal protein L21e
MSTKSSKGINKRTRGILRRKPRERGLSPITRAFQTYEVGEQASIISDPSMRKGRPHSAFHGKTGTVVGNQGRAYMMDVRIGNKVKKVIVLPEHMRKV